MIMMINKLELIEPVYLNGKQVHIFFALVDRLQERKKRKITPDEIKEILREMFPNKVKVKTVVWEKTEDDIPLVQALHIAKTTRLQRKQKTL